jgi:hypothetical protein
MRKIQAHQVWVWCALLAALLLAGCGAMPRPEQPLRSSDLPLPPGEQLGQTFTANFAGFSGVDLFLIPHSPLDGELTLILQPMADLDDWFSFSTLPLDQVTSPGYYRFEFQPRPDSTNHSFIFTLSRTGNGELAIGTAGGSTYLDGSLYQGDSPADGQMTFLLVYDRSMLLAGLGWEGLRWLGFLAAAAFLFVLPGWALLSGLWQGWNEKDWTEKAILSIGLSLAVYPVLILWSSVVSLRLGALYAWLPPLTGGAYLLWRRRGIRFPSTGLIGLFAKSTLPDLALFLVVGIVVFTRFWVVRTLATPLFGDSYQHSMIIQLLIDHGGLFQSWEPYAELTSFTYHFGLHANVAVFHWVTSLTAPDTLLWMGQILNIMAVLALAPLANRLAGNRWAGVFTVLIAGLASSMPMEYTNWGRYTQLAGQVILPVIALLAWESFVEKRIGWRVTFVLAILMAGLALTHYRVLIFAVVFLLAALIVLLRQNGLRLAFWQLFWPGVGALLLFLPWLLNVVGGTLIAILSNQVTSSPQAATPWQAANAMGELTSYLPLWIWLLLPLVGLWGLWRRNSLAIAVIVWSLLLLLATNPQWLGLPGQGVITNFALFIAAYIAAGVLLGGSLGWLVERIHKTKRVRASRVVQVAMGSALVVLVILSGGWFGRQRLQDIDPGRHALALQPDLRAATWIQQHIPADALFLVNFFTAYSDTLVVGSDGGWWLPLLAKRQITVPPLNYGTEDGPTLDYRLEVLDWHTTLANLGLDHPSAIEMLRARGVTHLYIGQQGGSINNPTPVLQPEVLRASPDFEVVYHQDRVWIFRMLPASEEQ